MILPFLLPLLFASSFVYERSIGASGEQVDVDELGHLYVTDGRKIEKWSGEGKKLFQASDLNFGEITHLDLSNPLMPFAYYRDQAKVVIFDNTLSPQGEVIDLFEKGYLQVEYICSSRGDAFWLWDARMSELVRTDRQFQLLHSTGNLGVLLGLNIRPVQILERGSSVYLVDPEAGILIFDIYGNYRTRLEVFPDYPIRVVDDQLIYIIGEKIHILSRTRVEEEVLQLPSTGFKSYTFWRGRLYLSGSGETKVYRYHADVKN
jgi:hypothetical protein